MSAMINFNAQVAPMEHVEKLVRQEQEHAQIRQEALLQNASQTLSKDNEQVPQTTQGKNGQRIERRKENGREQADQHGFARKHDDPGQMQNMLPETPEMDFSADVWSGNIINVKV